MKKFIFLLSLLFVFIQSYALTPTDKSVVGNLNLIENPGFESGFGNYTASVPATVSVVSGSSALLGSSSVTFDATATGQYFESALYSIPVGFQGGKCIARSLYKNGDGLNEIQIVDNSSTVVASKKILTSATARPISLKFTCPSSGSLKFKVISSGNAAALTVDDFSIRKDESKDDDSALFLADAESGDAYIYTYSGSGAKPDLTFGASTGNLSIGFTGSTPIAGTSSYSFSKTVSSSTQGQGWVIPFSIPEGKKAKWLVVNFEYLVSSGTFIAGSDSTNSDLEIFVFDITNNKLIELDTSKLYSSSALSDYFSGGFQSAPDSVNYALVIHSATTSANQFALKVESIKVGVPNKSNGPPESGWKLVTGVNLYGATNGLAFTNQTTVAFEKRIGDSVQYRIRTSFTGTPGTGTGKFEWSLPRTADTTRINTGNSATSGRITYIDSGTAFKENSYVYLNSATRISAISDGGVDRWDASAPITWTTNDAVEIVTDLIPMVGLESSSQQSESIGGRDIIFAASKTVDSSSFAAATDTAVAFTNVLKDSTNSWNGTDTFTVPSYGDYRVSVNLYWGTGASTTSTQGKIFVDGVLYAIPSVVNCSANSTSSNSFSLTIPNLRANQTIKVYGWVNAGTTSIIYGNANKTATLNIEKLQSSQTMSMNERVSFSANTSTTAATTSAPFVYTNVTDNSHGFYNPLTGIFKTKYPGFYCFNATYYAGATVVQGILYKNGSIQVAQGVGTVASAQVGSVAHCLPLLSDETMEVRPNTAATASGSSITNYFSGFLVK